MNNTQSFCCLAGCYTCQKNASCLTCNFNYYLNGLMCALCPNGQYNPAGNTNTNCLTTPCPIVCETCSSSDLTCLTCFKGFSLSAGTCVFNSSSPDNNSSNNNNNNNDSNSGLSQSTIIVLSTVIPICVLGMLINT